MKRTQTLKLFGKMLENSAVNPLPEEILLHLFTYLKPSDLSTISPVSKLWNLIAQDNTLWKTRAIKAMPHLRKPPSQTWKQHYITNYPGMFIKKIYCKSNLIYSAFANTIATWQDISPSKFIKQFSLQTTLTNHTGAITCFVVRFLGLKTVMITGSIDKTLKLWCKENSKKHFSLLQTLDCKGSAITAVNYVGNDIVCSDVGGKIFYWKESCTESLAKIYFGKQQPLYEKYKKMETIKGHKGKITHICSDKRELQKIFFQKTAVQRTFFTASTDKTIKIWHTTGSGIKVHQILPDIFGQLIALETPYQKTAPQRSWLFGGYTDGKLQIWERRKNNWFFLTSTIKLHDNLTALHFSKDGREAYSSQGNRIKIWQIFHQKNETHFKPFNSFSAEHTKTVISIQSVVCQEFKKHYICWVSQDELTQLAINLKGNLTKLTIPIKPPDPTKTVSFEEKNFLKFNDITNFSEGKS